MPHASQLLLCCACALVMLVCASQSSETSRRQQRRQISSFYRRRHSDNITNQVNQIRQQHGSSWMTGSQPQEEEEEGSAVAGVGSNCVLKVYIVKKYAGHCTNMGRGQPPHYCLANTRRHFTYSPQCRRMEETRRRRLRGTGRR